MKINISHKGKTYHLESDSEAIIGKKIGESIDGKDLSPSLEDYELLITGGSDRAGFPMMSEMEGTALKKVLLTKGWGMKTSRPKGLRLKKTVAGNTTSPNTVQINTIVSKEGAKKLEEIFPEQSKPKQEKKAEEKKEEEKAEEKSEVKTQSPAEIKK